MRLVINLKSIQDIDSIRQQNNENVILIRQLAEKNPKMGTPRLPARSRFGKGRANLFRCAQVN